MTISVAMCTYNGTRFLKAQLDSILDQTLQPNEIIICDDCSSDGTVTLARDLLSDWGGKWQVVENETNLGFRQNFEKAIQLCHGDIIFLSDQDDVWMPHKIEEMIWIFRTYPEVVLAFHDAKLVDENLRVLAPSFWKTLDFEAARFLKKDYRQLLGHNVVQGSACAFRRELVARACPFPEGAIHDEWLALTALSIGEIFPVAETLLAYRQWRENALGAGTSTIRERMQKWLFATKKAINIHKKYIDYKCQVNKIWEQRYGKEIQNRYPELLSCNRLMQKRYENIRCKKLRLFFLMNVYRAAYPITGRRMKELVKDVLAVID